MGCAGRRAASDSAAIKIPINPYTLLRRVSKSRAGFFCAKAWVVVGRAMSTIASSPNARRTLAKGKTCEVEQSHGSARSGGNLHG